MTTWDQYWSRRSPYDKLASLYRKNVLRYRLGAALHGEFQRGDHLLHAGCGSGEVDHFLHAHYRVTAMDISQRACGAIQGQ